MGYLARFCWQLGDKEVEKCAGTQVSTGEQEELQARSSSSLQPGRGPQRSRLSLCSPWAPHGADLLMQPQRSPWGGGGWGLKEDTDCRHPMQVPGSAVRGAHSGTRGLVRPEGGYRLQTSNAGASSWQCSKRSPQWNQRSGMKWSPCDFIFLLNW